MLARSAGTLGGTNVRQMTTPQQRRDQCRLAARCTPVFRDSFLRLCRVRGLKQAPLLKLLIREELERRGLPLPDET